MIELIQKAFNYGKDSYVQYKGTGSYFTLFLIAVMVIYFFRPERSEHENLKKKRISDRAYTVYYPLLAFFLIFSPLIAGPVVGVITTTVYWRIFWIIPMTTIIALAMAMLVMKLPAGPKRLLATIGCAVVIGVSGSMIVNSDNFQKPANWFKIPYETIEICEMIRNDTDSYANVAVPPTLVSYIRQYDASINMPYGRRTWSKFTPFTNDLYLGAPSLEKKKEFINRYSINYLVIHLEKPEVFVVPEWCDLVGVSGNYYLLKVR